MCGISGIISIDGRPIVSLEKRLELMTKSLHHRGPDKFGIYHTPKKILVLAIIDFQLYLLMKMYYYHLLRIKKII